MPARSANCSKAISAAAPATRTSCVRCRPGKRPWLHPPDRTPEPSIHSQGGKDHGCIRFFQAATYRRVAAAQSHAVFVRSPHAHARIERIRTDAARAAPGVLGVFTGADVAADKINGLP